MSTEDLTALSRDDIQRRISAVEEELEDVAIERSLKLGGAGLHIGGKEAERMRNELDRDEARPRMRLAELRGLLYQGDEHAGRPRGS